MSKRRGTLLIELGAALAVLAVASFMLVQMLEAVALQKRRLQQQVIASQTAANLLERELARPFAEIESRKDVDVSVDAARILGEARAALVVSTTAAAVEEPAAKRLTVTVTWSDAAGMEESLRLTAWRYAAEGPEP